MRNKLSNHGIKMHEDLISEVVTIEGPGNRDGTMCLFGLRLSLHFSLHFDGAVDYVYKICSSSVIFG